MILTIDQVSSISLSKTDEWINVARKDSVKLLLHYYGTDTDGFLKQISGLENAEQLELRKKHAIPNDYLTENLLRPIDNIWNAKGGSEKIDLPEKLLKDFKEKLKDVGKGYSLKQYIKEVWKDKLFSDPNGLTFVEVSEDGKSAYLTTKSIFNIKNMGIHGTKPEYVCFEPHYFDEDTKEKLSKKRLWLVDDLFYREIQIDNDETIIILQEKRNTFGRVPAIVNSPIIDTLREVKISPIQKQVKLLDSYLIGQSVKEIYQFLHGYPVFWMYAKKCNVCDGSGYVEGKKCPSCGGSGYNTKKDVSDAIALKAPTEEGQPVLAPNVAGYVQPDLETWREQRTELDWKYKLIEYSHWGTTSEKGANETATARWIDTQPVNNRLNVYADIAEDVHSCLLDLLGQFYYTSYKGSNVHYGRRFLIETPDQVWNKYLNAKKENAPISAKNQLLEQYYESEYQKNQLLLDYYLKLVKIEPFVHNTIEDVIKMPITEIEKAMKTYFSEWLQTKMINEIVDKDRETLLKELETYCNDIKKKELANKEQTKDTLEDTEEQENEIVNISQTKITKDV